MAERKIVYEIKLKVDPEKKKILQKILDGTIKNNDSLDAITELNLNEFDAMSKDNLLEIANALSQRDATVMKIALDKNTSFETRDEDLVKTLLALDLIEEPIVKEYEMNGPTEILNEPTPYKEEGKEEESDKPREFAPETEEQKEEDKEKIAELTKDVKDEKEKTQIVKEYYETRYYLTGSRLLEQIQKTSLYSNQPQDVRRLIDEAYSSVTDPNDLNDPDFLNKKLTNYFQKERQMTGEISGFEELHMAALGNTYVGYHVEEVGKNEAKTLGVEKPDEQYIALPQFASDMPESLKEEAKRRGSEWIARRVSEVVCNLNGYDAARRLDNPEQFVGEEIDHLNENLGSTGEETSIKVFLNDNKMEFIELFKNVKEAQNEIIVAKQKDWDKTVGKSLDILEKSVFAMAGLGPYPIAEAAGLVLGLDVEVDNDRNEVDRNLMSTALGANMPFVEIFEELLSDSDIEEDVEPGNGNRLF